MTPEEFKARAERAVATVEPDARSHAWLRDNVARRRSHRRVAYAAVATAAVAAVATVAVALPGGAGRDPSTAIHVTPTATAAPVEGDVDGDGRADEATVVEYGDRGDPEWHWGVEVDNGTHALIEVLRPPGAEANESQEVVGLVDVNLDGRAEVVVRAGGTASTSAYLVAIYIGSHLRWLSDEHGEPMFFQVGGDPAAIRYGWGCSDLHEAPGRELYRTETRVEAHRRFEARVVYTMEADRLYEVDRDTRSRPASEPVNREYEPAIRCGSLDG